MRELYTNRQRKNQLDLLPMDIYDALEETLPHGLVVRLGEIIIKLQGVGPKEK